MELKHRNYLKQKAKQEVINILVSINFLSEKKKEKGHDLKVKGEKSLF